MPPNYSLIFSLFNTARTTEFLNKSSKHSGSSIPSLTEKTYGITLILPNLNMSMWMAPLPTETPEMSTYHNPFPFFHSCWNLPHSQKLFDRSSTLWPTKISRTWNSDLTQNASQIEAPPKKPNSHIYHINHSSRSSFFHITQL